MPAPVTEDELERTLAMVRMNPPLGWTIEQVERLAAELRATWEKLDRLGAAAGIPPYPRN